MRSPKTPPSYAVQVPHISHILLQPFSLFSDPACSNTAIPTDSAYSGTVVYIPTALVTLADTDAGGNLYDGQLDGRRPRDRRHQR